MTRLAGPFTTRHLAPCPDDEGGGGQVSGGWRGRDGLSEEE